MTFKLVNQILASLIKTIEQTAVVSVNAIKAHTFSSKIINFPKTQKIKGVVTVVNQKKVERELKNSKKIQDSILKWLNKFTIPSNFKIDNFPESIKFPTSIEISNQIKPIKPLAYPKNIRITNQPTKEIKKINTQLIAVKKAIGKLKLNPSINVETPIPEKIIVPPANVTVKQIDYKKLAKLMPEPAKEFDYKKLAETIAKEMAEMFVTVGGGGRRKEGEDDLTRQYNVANKDVAGDVKYYGFTGRSGEWYILKEDSINYTYLYYKGKKSYPINWENRVDLVYDYYHNIF